MVSGTSSRPSPPTVAFDNFDLRRAETGVGDAAAGLGIPDQRDRRLRRQPAGRQDRARLHRPLGRRERRADAVAGAIAEPGPAAARTARRRRWPASLPASRER